jgi:rhodanese-related sulfurtransferase
MLHAFKSIIVCSGAMHRVNRQEERRSAIMKKGFKELIAEANSAVKTYSVHEAQGFLGNTDVAFIDLREEAELLRDGIIPNAVHVPRGMLEFVIDPDSPYHNKVFTSGKQFIFYCAAGSRSALGTQVAQVMGLDEVAHVAGGMKAWKEAGAPVAAYQP